MFHLFKIQFLSGLLEGFVRSFHDHCLVWKHNFLLEVHFCVYDILLVFFQLNRWESQPHSPWLQASNHKLHPCHHGSCPFTVTKTSHGVHSSKWNPGFFFVGMMIGCSDVCLFFSDGGSFSKWFSPLWGTAGSPSFLTAMAKPKSMCFEEWFQGTCSWCQVQKHDQKSQSENTAASEGAGRPSEDFSSIHLVLKEFAKTIVILLMEEIRPTTSDV